jgi:hypothetical protein
MVIFLINTSILDKTNKIIKEYNGIIFVNRKI